MSLKLGKSFLSNHTSVLKTLILSLVFLPNIVLAADLYVSTSGSDSNPGTQSAPFRTIQKAVSVVQAGTTVHVAPGTYTGNIYSTVSGTASARIRYVSDTKWGAKIVPPSSGTTMAWDNRGSYVDIVDFEVDGRDSSVWVYGIYSVGSYGTVQGNHIHHIGTAPTCSNMGGAGAGTDYYYYGVANEFIGNVIHHIGSPTCNYIQGIYMASNGKVKNNLIYAVGAAGIHLWHDATDVDINNNTVVSSGIGIVVGAGEQYHRTGVADNVHVSNNIIFDNLYGISEQDGTTGIHNTYANNLVYQNKNYNWYLLNGLTDSGTIAADPQFVSYGRDMGDYHLKSTSPAIDKGSSTYAPSADLDGNVRPSGAAVDIGAYEFVSQAPSPSPTPAPSPSPSPSASVSVSATQVAPGGAFNVNVSGAGLSTQAYAALYLASAADADYAYNGNWQYLNGTQTEPSSPVNSATLKFVAPMELGTYNIRIYSTDAGTAGSRLAISQNIQVVVASDVTAPSTSIASPANGSYVASRRYATIQASASDNVGVKTVEFYVNGSLKCTDTTAPYSCSWYVPRGRGKVYSLQNKAKDAAGNIGSSSIVKVTSY